MDAAIPKRIGRYEIDRLLGSGAMGHVFLGRDPELDRPVAIKTVRDLNMDAEALATFIERFRNEARAAARLHHPNIVQVYDVGEDDAAGPYLVFEYVAGATLKQTLRSRGPFEPEAVCRMGDEIASALALAHENGIIHRDVKPDNVLLTPTGTSKLADFGVARVPNAALTREGQFLGTPCYAAPETLDTGTYGPGSDVFSFAAMLYEVISGARAFPGTDAVAVAHKVLHDEPRPLPEVSKETKVPGPVGDAVMRGLAKDPKVRFESATALADAVRDAYVQAGLVREPSRSFDAAAFLDSSARGRRSGESRGGGGGGNFAFFAVLAGAMIAGLGIVLAFTREDPSVGATDAGVEEAAADAATANDPVGEEQHASVADAGLGLIVLDLPDLGVPALDAGAQTDAGSEEGPDASGALAAEIAAMTPHEREEAAKDALGEARRALEAGNLERATQSLERAAALDPGNGDIPPLRSRLAAMAP